MSTTMDLINVAVDAYKGVPSGNYSVEQSLDAVRNGLIAINNGKEYLDYKDIRDGKCNGLFAVIEEIITKTVIDGLQGNEFFMNLVEYKNMALGDKNEFYTPDDSLFNVATIARGTQGIRRQRLNGGSKFSVDIKTYGVKIYAELDAVLAGRINFNDLINRVSESLLKKQYEDIYLAWGNMISGTGSTYLPVAGSYNEDSLLELCEHVEVNNGVVPTILGTRKALRRLTSATVSDSAKEDLYNMGYYGKFNGYNMVRIKQQHKTNTDEFIFPDNKIYVVGTDIKPIKYITEGQSLIIARNPEDNADLTQEYFVANKAGAAVIMPDKKIGVYTMSV